MPKLDLGDLAKKVHDEYLNRVAFVALGRAVTVGDVIRRAEALMAENTKFREALENARNLLHEVQAGDASPYEVIDILEAALKETRDD